MKIFTVVITAVVASTLLLTGCSASATATGGSASQDTSTANTDPKLGWVVFDTGRSADSSGSYVAKKCDGSTLVYVSDGNNSGGVSISIVVNSPECAT